MRKRITTAIVGVTAFILLALGIPLAIVVQRATLRSEVVELQTTVAETLTEIEVPIDTAQLASLAAEPDAPPPFQVFDASGVRLFGDGVGAPTVVAQALDGKSATGTDGQIAAATPITDGAEHVVGVLVVTESLHAASTAARRAWLVMLASAIVALGCAWLIADRLGRRLAQPIVDLAQAAGRTGIGGILDPPEPTDIEEIDRLQEVLSSSSIRLNEAVARERQFSADVSHQLRTPLTALRLQLESDDFDDHRRQSAVADLARLETTIDHLLHHARDAAPTSGVCAIDDVVTAAAQRWRLPFDAAGRVLVTQAVTGRAANVSEVALGQVLDVLIDNALHHGCGDVVVATRVLAGGSAIDVGDAGAVASGVNEVELFDRHQGTNHGIGLALARSIAEAEGGRLVLSSRSPTRFSVVLVGAAADVPPCDQPMSSDEAVAATAVHSRSGSVPPT